MVAAHDWHEQARQRGLARAAEFTWEKAAEATLSVYRACLGP